MAIDLDPNGIEPLIQCAQLKTMFGDLQTAMDLANRALPLTRSRDEVRLLLLFPLLLVLMISVLPRPSRFSILKS
jgi:hypothetical protein